MADSDLQPNNNMVDRLKVLGEWNHIPETEKKKLKKRVESNQ